MFSLATIHLLLIEDEEYDVRRIRNTLKPFQERIVIVDVASSGQMAIDLLQQHRNAYDVVIMDFQIAGGLMGERLIRRIKEIDPTLQIIVVTKMTINLSDFEFASRLLEAGAMWYCTKYPGDIEEYIYQPTDFILSIYNAYEKNRMEKAQQKSDRKLQKNIEDILTRKKIIGQSASSKRLQAQIQQFAASDTNVLIRGSSGTGKELVATHIHYLSRRRFENFVPINCGSLPDNLIESELFGFEKGAFTGASAGKPGLFEVAHRGTIFLDEITELPLSAQSKLLRVIQEGEIDKIGRIEKIKVDVRIIAATNKNLEQEVREKRFREDLYYRLNVVFIDVPPLRQRRDDIPALIEYFLQLFSEDMNRPRPEICAEALQVLQEYDWPGNVRELQNVVQRLLFLEESHLSAGHARIVLGFRDEDEAALRKESLFWDAKNILPWRDMEKQLRAAYFTFVREQAATDADAARLLGLAPPNYYRMCKELGLK